MPTFNGTPGDDTLTGTEDDDVINGLAGNDQISGLGGNDIIDGGEGSDTIDGGAGDDVIDSGNTTGLAGDTIHGGTGNDTLTANGSVLGTRLYGDADDDHLIVHTNIATADGGDGNDTIEVFGGNVTILGGAGNDIILYNGTTFGNVPGSIDAGDGDDRIIFLSTGNRATPITLGSGHDVVEVRYFGAKISDFAVGDSGDQIDLSFFGPNPIASGQFRIVQSGADTWIQEVATEAIYVQLLNVQASSLTAYNLSGLSPGGDLTITGTPGDDQLTGGAGNDSLSGLGGNDRLDGAGGADLMTGGQGNDIYYVDNGGDVVVEAAGEGYDRLLSSVGYVLGAGVEVELLATTNNAGTGAIDLTGNEFGQAVVGNNGDNVLRGGGGMDALVGLGGNDTLYVDGDDSVVEAVGGGNDKVIASTTYVLTAGAEVELLATGDNAGTVSIDLTGNAFGQAIVGNDGANGLRGGGGLDALVGLGGNDIFFVDSDDAIYENAGGGYDWAFASATYVLTAGAEVELLSSSDNGGTVAVDLTGNAFGQAVVGNDGANVLNGGLGQDALVGLGGADTFQFTTALGATNVDTIVDFVSGTDKIALDDAVFTAIGGLGALNANAVVVGTAAADANDRIIYDSATGNLYYDADGNGAGAQILFANLQGNPTLLVTDIQVI